MQTIAIDAVAREVAEAIDAIRAARRARGQLDLDGEAATPASAAAIRSRVRYYADMLELAGCDPEGVRALDAGCGPGFGLVTLAALGAASVTGFEILSGRSQTTREYLSDLPHELRARIEVAQGDACDMPCGDGSFDLIVSNEASKSYLDLSAFCAEAARAMTSGGVLIVADRNNMRNPRLRRRTLDLWEAYESGPVGIEIHGHRIENPYVLQRERIIESAFGELSAERVRSLARRTFALTEDEILAACGRHLDGGPAPSTQFRRGVVPVDPVGMVPEALVDPFELARELERHGLRARACGYWGGADGRPAVRAADRLLRGLSPVTIATAPAFRVTARKP